MNTPTQRSRPKQGNKSHLWKRYGFIAAAILLFALAIVIQLVNTTVVHRSRWNDKAAASLNVVKVLAPERGKLLADNGTVLAANMQYYVVRIDWLAEGIKGDSLAKYLPALADSLAVFDPTYTAAKWQERLWECYERVAQKKPHKGDRAWRLFKHALTHSQLERLRTFPYFNNKKISTGLTTESESRRLKPYGSMASRSIGFVSRDENCSEMRGHSGLELALDSLLYGIAGHTRRVQVTNNIIDLADIEPPVPGYDITTTINVALQDIVEVELSKMLQETDAIWGSAVLMEVATGEIKAISNLRRNSQNPEQFEEGINNAVTGYEPGSVMKPISMMVALEDGIITNIDEPMATGSVFVYGNKTIRDHPGGPSLTPREIIATSSNIGMTKIILRRYESQPGKFRDRLEQMGFFEPFNTGIAGEQVPLVRRLGNRSEDRLDLTRMAFGYATHLPPLRTLAMYNAMANDGKFVRPHLVKRLSREGQPDSIVPITYIRKQVCSPENAQKLRIMLRDVVTNPRGTGYRALHDCKVSLAGKTGTVFEVDPETKAYTNRRRFTFCGFFPYEHPLYSCIVIIFNSNRGAAAASGGVMRRVAEKMYARGMLGIEPRYDMTVDHEGNTVKRAQQHATLLASSVTSAIKRLRNELNLKQAQMLAQSDNSRTPKNRVPNVYGYGAREAIRRLEDAGLCVRLSGSGYVCQQSIPAGSPFTAGTIINLTLKQ